MDPVAELAALAAAHGVGCHVDACIGGFVLPFLERLGHDVPPWDFRVPGSPRSPPTCTSTATARRARRSMLHRDADWFGHQVFLFDDWPSGLYGSPAIAGARPAAPIATAWAVMSYLGADGYTELMRDLMETAAQVRAGIEAIPGIEIVGDPIGPVLSFRSDEHDLYAVADVMDDRGWNLNRNTEPARSPPDAVPSPRRGGRRAPRRSAFRGRAPWRVARCRGSILVGLIAESPVDGAFLRHV